MNAYQNRLIEEERMKQQMQSVTDEGIREKRLNRIKELMEDPGDENFAALSLSIHLAATQGRVDAVNWFVRTRRATVDDYDGKGFCAIHYAAEKGHEKVVKAIVDLGGDVDIPSSTGVTAMMTAAKGGHAHILRQLWEFGALLTSTDLGGMTAAHYAAQEDNADAIHMLYSLALDEARILKGGTIAPSTANNKRRDSESVVPSRLKNPAPSAILDTSASIARMGSVESVASIDISSVEVPDFAPMSVIDSPSKNGRCPSHVAAAFDARQALEALISLGVNLSYRDALGETPMHKAARRNLNLAYNLLLQAGADPFALNHMKDSPQNLLIDKSYY